jgi:hypothetical protein
VAAGELFGLLGVEWGQFVGDGRASGGEAGVELLEAVSKRSGSVPDDQRHPLAGGATGQVVGETQRGLIGLV